MEHNCTLTNEELIERAQTWVHKLAETGGRAWNLRVPVDFNNDPDMLFIELCNRLNALAAVPVEPEPKSFSDLSKEEIASILNLAMDSGDWHTPSATDIQLSDLANPQAVYGWCNISLHSNYHDKEVWFNINANSVKIWEKKYIKGKIDKSEYRPIYNIEKLAEVLNPFKPKTPSS